MQTQIYSPEDLPVHIRWQILGFMRTEWYYAFQGRLRGRRWIGAPEFNPTNIVLMDDDFLIAHAEVEYRLFHHLGEKYHTYGLSSVFVYNDYRGAGYGKQIVEIATDYIHQQDNAQIAMLWCDPTMHDFYLKCGWDAMDSTQTWLGTTPENAQHDPDQLLFMKFIDPTVKQATFHEEKVYFGWTTW